MMRLRRPSWFAVLVTLAGVALFVRLGVWQLDRADYKEHLLQVFANAASAPRVTFDKVEHGVPDDSYPHVGVRGHFVHDRYYLLDDRTRAGRVGVEVYAPFAVAGTGRRLLVDLGFLPRARNNELPHLPPLVKGDTEIRGLYAKAPRPGLKLGGDSLPSQHDWPKLGIYIDLDEISRDLGHPMFPRVLLIDPDPGTTYLRQWVPDTMPPSRHRGYAFQWFSFAVAAVVIFLIMHRRRPDKRDPHE